MASSLSKEEAKQLIREFLRDPELRAVVEEELASSFAPKQPTEDHLQRLYEELLRQRELSEKRWEEWKAENERRWEENQRWWEENQRRLDEHQKYLEALYQKLEELDYKQRVSLGAIGARWGVATEHAFRESMKAILEGSFGVKVERYMNYDTEGIVFSRPDQVELDLIIYDSQILVAEIKSSVSRPDVHAFLNKVAFYERKEGRTVTRKLIISPMVPPEAKKLAKAYGVEVYSYPTEKQLKKGPRKRKTPPSAAG